MPVCVPSPFAWNSHPQAVRVLEFIHLHVSVPFPFTITYYSCLENGTYSMYMILLIIIILLLRIVLELILNQDRYFHLVRTDIKSEARLVIMTLVEGSRD